MFDVGWSEMLLIVAVAIVVIGPKDLPRALYAAGKFTRKIKIFTGDIQRSLDKIMHEAELDEITREANKIGGPNLQFEIERQLQEEEKKKLSSTSEGGAT
ncbi:MAG: twin-arginine translocase subunit TatB [Alphaproteobacteria bacterium]|nr:MAG: twin-arginine translocase subunit TatB [Alphaproteobacteria bacterium]